MLSSSSRDYTKSIMLTRLQHRSLLARKKSRYECLRHSRKKRRAALPIPCCSLHDVDLLSLSATACDNLIPVKAFSQHTRAMKRRIQRGEYIANTVAV